MASENNNEVKEQEKNKKQKGRIDVYVSKCEISSNGNVNRNKTFYAECGSEFFGGEGDEKHFASLVALEIGLFVEDLGNNLEFVINYNGWRPSISAFVDGYFGRPAYHDNTIRLHHLNRRERKEFEAAINFLKQKYPQLNLLVA